MVNLAYSYSFNSKNSYHSEDTVVMWNSHAADFRLARCRSHTHAMCFLTFANFSTRFRLEILFYFILPCNTFVKWRQNDIYIRAPLTSSVVCTTRWNTICNVVDVRYLCSHGVKWSGNFILSTLVLTNTEKYLFERFRSRREFFWHLLGSKRRSLHLHCNPHV